MGIFSKARHLATAKAQSQQYMKNLFIISFKSCLMCLNITSSLLFVFLCRHWLRYMHRAIALPNRKAFALYLGNHGFKSWRCHSHSWPWVQESIISHALQVGKMALLSPMPIKETLANCGGLWAHVCRSGQLACSAEFVQMPCDVAWATIQKSCSGWLHVSQRKHMLPSQSALIKFLFS